MKLIITSTDKHLDSLAKGAPEGVSVKAMNIEEAGHAIPPELEAIYTIAIDWAEPVTQGILAAWLYDKLKTLKGKIVVNGRNVNNQDDINEEIDKKRRKDNENGE